MPRPRTILAITTALAVIAAIIFFVIPRDPPPPPQVLPWAWDDIASVTVRPVRPDPGQKPYDMTSADDLMDFRRAMEAATLTVTPNPDRVAVEAMVRVDVTLQDGKRFRFRSAIDDHWIALVGERVGPVIVTLRGASLAAFLDARRERAIDSSKMTD